MAGLYEELLALSENGRIPFHMPGHARRDDFEGLGSAARIDFTEIDGLDNLHAPEGILREAMERAAKVWGADRAFFLVGGSTVGMLAAVRALCKGGRPLLLAGPVRGRQRADGHGQGVPAEGSPGGGGGAL